MPRVNWFETESSDHPFGNPGEQDHATAEEALAQVEQLKARNDVVHVQYHVEHEHRPGMPDGEVIQQGWVRDDDTGAWRQQYVERLGSPYESESAD